MQIFQLNMAVKLIKQLFNDHIFEHLSASVLQKQQT